MLETDTASAGSVRLSVSRKLEAALACAACARVACAGGWKEDEVESAGTKDPTTNSYDSL